MASFNRYICIGNVTRDAEVRFTPNGKAVAEIGLAVNEVYKTESGEKRETTVFLDVEAWGRTAEIAGEYCKKGKQVCIEGKLRQDTWDDKTTGQKRSKIKVVCENLQLLGGKDDNQTGAQSTSQPARPPARPIAPAKPAADPDLDADDSDKIPW